MRQVNVIIKCSDEAFDMIVVPFKKNKKLSPLLNKLLEGYISDPYIRAYGDNVIEDYNRESMRELNKYIDSMVDSLSNMGMFTEELDSIASMGADTFTKTAEGTYTENVGTTEQKTTKAEETHSSDLDKRMDKLENGLDKLTEMMAEFLSSKFVAKEEKPSHNISIVEEQSSSDDNSNEETDESEDEVVTPVDLETANNFMSKLMGMNMESF